MTEPMTDDRLASIASLKQRGAWAAALESIRLRFEQDAARIRAAEAARDAALARAMPEPVLMETAEQVEALPAGAYRVLAPWRPREWLLGHRYPTRTWTLLIGMGASGVMDDHIVGSWVQPLPDLPIPTPGDANV